MATKKRRFESRTYRTTDGRDLSYTVYYIEGRNRPAIEEEEALKLATDAGCHSFEVVSIQAFEDNMFFASDTQIRKYQEKYPTSIRYVAICRCIGPDGMPYEDTGNGAPDNIDMVKNYCPEMAVKRARVRSVILALGIKGINADAEFPDNDNAALESLEEQARLKSEIKKQLTALKIGDDEAGITQKKAFLAECFNGPMEGQTLNNGQLEQFLTFLKSKEDK